MPGLAKLSADQEKALSTSLVKSYSLLQAKTGTLKDDKDAQAHVESIIIRFNTVSNAPTAGGAEALVAMKEQYLQAIRAHGAQMALLAFSKPDDVANRLRALQFDEDAIKKMQESMEQPGATEDEICSVVTSVVTCETSSALLGGGGHHHHHGHHRW